MHDQRTSLWVSQQLYLKGGFVKSWRIHWHRKPNLLLLSVAVIELFPTPGANNKAILSGSWLLGRIYPGNVLYLHVKLYYSELELSHRKVLCAIFFLFFLYFLSHRRRWWWWRRSGVDNNEQFNSSPISRKLVDEPVTIYCIFTLSWINYCSKKERKKEEQYHRKTNQHQRHQNKKPKTAEKNGNIINSASNNTRRTVEFSWRAPPQEANVGAGEERKMKSKQKHTDRTAYLTCRLCGHPESTPSVMSSSLLLFHTCVTATLSSPHVPELHRLTTRRGCPRDCRRSNASHRQLSSTSLTGGPPLHC